jgi:hypothetical protein
MSATTGEKISSEEADYLAQEAERYGQGNGQDTASSEVKSASLPAEWLGFVGMDYDDIRNMLAGRHQTTVGHDDPILMMVTICNAHLAEMEKLFRKHHEMAAKLAVSKVLDGRKSDEEVLPHLPDLPDGQKFGIDYERIQSLLASKHGTMVGRDDPILMMVSLCNANLEEIKRLYDVHSLAFKQLMSEQIAHYIETVKATTGNLGEVLKEKGIESIREMFDSHVKALDNHAKAHAKAINSSSSNALWCAGIIVAAAAVNVVLMAIKMWG